ncbi:MAG: LamG-like jellyroll fold domain-containing protein, partial [Verrucomicrobiota bacterium]
MDYDDAFVAYINGVEVARNNIVGVPPDFTETATAGHEASGGDSSPSPVEFYNLSPTVLAPGVNVLAIQGHNSSLTSSDFSLIPALTIGTVGDPSLVGHWKLDDGSGLTALDSSGNNNDGALLNGPVWATGTFGGALRFDGDNTIGSNDYVDLGNSASLNPPSQITLSAWVNPATLANTVAIITKMGGDSSSLRQYLLRIQFDGRVRFGVANTVLNGTAIVPVNTWTLITGTYDGAQLKIYINGVLDASLNKTGGMSNNGLNARIGGREPSPAPLTFNGRLDDVRLYNRALTQTEVQALLSPSNLAPVVNAGTDQTIVLPATASLSGTANDDGLPNPPATLTTTWSKFSGPGTVSFGNASVLNTTASFSINGTYVLRLTVSDSSLPTTDDVTITVNPASSGNQ